MSYRPQLWEAAFNTAMNHPLIGHGFHAEFQFNVVPGWPLSDPHNVELAVLLELGAVGLGLWGLMYACAFWKAIEYRRDGEYLAASTMLVYGLVAGMSEGSSYLSRPNESWFLIWLPLSLMAALSINKRLSLKH
ncbi:O-antigen ligase [Pseudomonas sp. JG-B]|uniref:O-antigen ligase family protein n=1 Tax=Pseudomonas sp. JG-B TaxID=2603214 RepID=UPI00129D89B9|nr:O-antigen ligase family protein [Pseudomonas sp. JG-B]MRK19129.1 O-antigen ligase family protein [Pseudomonas sp. JG-B]